MSKHDTRWRNALAMSALCILGLAACANENGTPGESTSGESSTPTGTETANIDPMNAGAPSGAAAQADQNLTFSLDALSDGESADGRLIVILAANNDKEPRFQTSYRYDGAQIFGMDVTDAEKGATLTITPSTPGVNGFPNPAITDLPDGEFYLQAVFNRYNDFNLSNGKTVSLPASWDAGQNWRREPGNLFSTPQSVTVRNGSIVAEVALDQVNPEIEPPKDTQYIKHVEIVSERLTEFWGREMKLGANVLLPHGFEENPDAKYPLMIFHGHFPDTFRGFRTEPPDPNLECQYSARFDLPCYNRTEQEEAYDFYKQWTAPDFPRVIIIEIQHANPYYDDSYAVNSEVLGPYGDAITYELIPFVEEKFRGLGEGWSRFMYGGSTGGWESMAVQVFYPEDYNGAYIACPDPIDFREYVGINIYEADNAYYREGPFGRVARPGHRNYLGHVNATIEMFNKYELALGEKGRSGDQFDIWEAVYSPMGEDGYPKRIWDRQTGKIDKDVASFWRENYDLTYILKRDWSEIGPKLQGKLNIYTGDMDNYYLNNAVYLTEDFLTKADPPFEGEIDYGDRAEHCWNGDHENPNAISRLRYNTFYLPKILKRIEATAPDGADLTSWRH
jgi:hypothetical protein